MKSNKFTHQNIEETLNSIDGINKSGMPAFFYTRLQAKLNNSIPVSQPFWLLVTKPAVSLVTLSLLVVLNIAAINYFIKSNKEHVLTKSNGIRDFALEYNLTGELSLYNNKKIK